MKTIIETATFKKQADKIWSEDERLEFSPIYQPTQLQGMLSPTPKAHEKYAGQQKAKASVVA